MSFVSRTNPAGLTIASGFEALLRTHALDTLDALFAFPNDQALSKRGLEPWRERLRLRLRDNDADDTFYLKRFRDPPAAARREVRRSGSGANSVAGIEWAWMHGLAGDGIGCTKPVAFGEEIVDGRERRSAVLMAEVPGRSLESWVEGGAACASASSLPTRAGPAARGLRAATDAAATDAAAIDAAAIDAAAIDAGLLPSPLVEGGPRGVLHSSKNLPRPILGKEGGKTEGHTESNSLFGTTTGRAARDHVEGLADFVRRFHASGYVHRDLYLSHIFFDPTAEPGDRFRLIDLQRVMKPDGAHRRWIVKDLAALNYSVPMSVASTADRMRWLKRYLGVNELDDAARRWVYRIVGKTQRIARHDRRRAARLATQLPVVDPK